MVGAGMTRSSLWDMSLPDLTNAPRQKERSRLVGRNVLSVICRWPCRFQNLDPSLGPPCAPRCASHVCVGTRGYTCMRSYCSLYCPHNASHGSNIITISCARLRLRLYYCPPYRNSPRGFRSPRACYDLFLPFPALPLFHF